MCVTKKNYKLVQSKREFERKDLANGGAPAYTPATTVTPATKSTEGTATKSGDRAESKSKKVSKEKTKGNAKSDVEKKSENQPEKVTELKKLADQATSMGQGPPVMPPIKRNIKREIGKKEKDPKDPEYITLEETVPDFAKAKLMGFNDDATLAEQREKEKTLRVEATQPSSGEEIKKKKKTSGEKSSGGSGGASKE